MMRLQIDDPRAWRVRPPKVGCWYRALSGILLVVTHREDKNKFRFCYPPSGTSLRPRSEDYSKWSEGVLDVSFWTTIEVPGRPDRKWPLVKRVRPTQAQLLGYMKWLVSQGDK